MTEHNKRLLDLYTDFLLVSFGQVSATAMSRLLPGYPSKTGEQPRSGHALPFSARANRQRPLEDRQAPCATGPIPRRRSHPRRHRRRKAPGALWARPERTHPLALRPLQEPQRQGHQPALRSVPEPRRVAAGCFAPDSKDRTHHRQEDRQRALAEPPDQERDRS